MLQLLTNPRGELVQGIRPGQNEINDEGVDGQLRSPDSIQKRFKLMSQIPHGIERKKSRPSFERVERSENGINGFAIRRMLLEDQ